MRRGRSEAESLDGDENEPIIDCALGQNWRVGAKPTGTCASNALTCYCGSTSAQNCANAEPAQLNGVCKNEILVGTACNTQPSASQSACVAPIMLNPANSSGKALQYAQCLGDNCFDSCF